MMCRIRANVRRFGPALVVLTLGVELSVAQTTVTGTVTGRPALPPPDADRLQPRVLGAGVAEILLPVGLPVVTVEAPFAWSAWSFASNARELTDEWAVNVYDFGEMTTSLEQEQTQHAAAMFGNLAEATIRWSGRRIDGATPCIGSSVALKPLVLWDVVCRSDGRDFVIYVVADPAPLRDPDAVVEKIVRSFKVGDAVTEYASSAPPVNALEEQTLEGILSVQLPVGLRMWAAPDPIGDWAFGSPDNLDMIERWDVRVHDGGPMKESLRSVADSSWGRQDVGPDRVERFRARSFAGVHQCVGNSYDLAGHRHWEVWCEAGDRLVELRLDLEEADSPTEGDEAVQRMVQSLRMLR
jgi:hypothetical protein